MGILQETAIFLLFFMSTYKLVESCSCYPKHSQEIFCSKHTDVVIKAVVLSGKNKWKQNLSRDDLHIFGLDYYNAHITKIFKGEKVLREVLISKNGTANFNPRHQKAILYTSSTSGTCGVTLKKGIKYLLSGSVTQGRIEISTCDWIAPYQNISRQQKHGIMGGYDCECQLRKCPIGRQCDVSESECEWSGRFTSKLRVLECDLKHRMCKRLKGKCLWFEDSHFEPCVMESAFNILTYAEKRSVTKPPM